MDNFDQTTVFEEEIKKKVLDLKLLCIKHKIPFFVTFAVANDENDTLYKNDALIPKSSNIVLTNDLFPKHINVLNGFETVPMKTEMEAEYINTDDESDDLVELQFTN